MGPGGVTGNNASVLGDGRMIAARSAAARRRSAAGENKAGRFFSKGPFSFDRNYNIIDFCGLSDGFLPAKENIRLDRYPRILEAFMQRFHRLPVGLVPVFLLLGVAIPGFAKTHKDVFDVPCNVLWPAVKDTLRNSGKYGIIGIDNGEMTASYNIGGFLAGKRINSLVLNSKGNTCEMQVQTSYSGLENNDAGDLKKRVKQSLDKQQAEPNGRPATTSEIKLRRRVSHVNAK